MSTPTHAPHAVFRDVFGWPNAARCLIIEKKIPEICGWFRAAPSNKKIMS
jgi:hypothetical protein